MVCQGFSFSPADHGHQENKGKTGAEGFEAYKYLYDTSPILVFHGRLPPNARFSPFRGFGVGTLVLASVGKARVFAAGEKTGTATASESPGEALSRQLGGTPPHPSRSGTGLREPLAASMRPSRLMVGFRPGRPNQTGLANSTWRALSNLGFPLLRRLKAG